MNGFCLFLTIYFNQKITNRRDKLLINYKIIILGIGIVLNLTILAISIVWWFFNSLLSGSDPGLLTNILLII